MTFKSAALGDMADVRDAGTGGLIDQLSTPVPCWSGIATVGNVLVLGTGTTAVGSPDGVMASTPEGTTPVVPPS